MAVMWSVGAILEEKVRAQFHEFMMALIKGENVQEHYKLDLMYDS